jgi:hypothetical protein
VYAQGEWAVCKVFNKDLLAAKKTGAPMEAADAAELERVGSLEFISDFLDFAEPPPLMDPPSFGADVDEAIDSKGLASTSSHGAAQGGVSYLPVKTEEQYLNHQPQAFYARSSPYFSLPAMNSGDLPTTAIRRYCKAEQVASGLSTDPNAAAGYAEISSAATPSSSHHHQNQFLLPELDDTLLNVADIWKY